jgi:uncharacterized membrane protein
MTRSYWIVAATLLAGAVAATAWLYPGLPDRIPTHWNFKGEVDGYGGKWTLFLLPVMTAPLLALFYFLPALSPRHFGVESFRSTYLYIMAVTIGLFVFMQAVLLYTVERFVHGDRSFDIGRAFFAGVFLFFALMGNVMGKVRKNFYIGIRTPWTLASERVWNDTHRLAAWVMTTAGLIGFAMTIVGLPFWASFVLLIGSMLGLLVYSFVHYRALERAGQLEP